MEASHPDAWKLRTRPFQAVNFGNAVRYGAHAADRAPGECLISVGRLEPLPTRHIDRDRVIGNQQVRHETAFSRAPATGCQMLCSSLLVRTRASHDCQVGTNGPGLHTYGAGDGNRTRTVSLGSRTIRRSYCRDLRWKVSATDRERPPVTGVNGTLMARQPWGAGFPALVQGRSCRVRVGRCHRQTVGGEKAGRPEPYTGGAGARAPAWTALQVLIALALDVSLIGF